jgi:hypothetical protein
MRNGPQWIAIFVAVAVVGAVIFVVAQLAPAPTAWKEDHAPPPERMAPGTPTQFGRGPGHDASSPARASSMAATPKGYWEIDIFASCAQLELDGMS